MRGQTKHHETSLPQANFSLLDIVGISMSTLLFTIVWVGVFSVFLPEKSNLVLSDGLRQLATKNESSVSSDESLRNVLREFRSYTYKTSVNALSTVLSVVQTGGSVKAMLSLTQEKVQVTYCAVSSCALPQHSTQSVSFQRVSVPKEFVGTTLGYLNTVTFGLISRADMSLYADVTPVRVVQKNGSYYSCSGSLCMVRS